MRGLGLALLAALVAGCGTDPREKPVPVEAVPAPVLEAAREKLPGVEFTRALQRSPDRYEVRGTDRTGKVHTINLTAAGEVLEVE